MKLSNLIIMHFYYASKLEIRIKVNLLSLVLKNNKNNLGKIFIENIFSVQDTTFTVQGLTENGEYLFRVMAVNENGQSAPLEGVNPIIAKLPFGELLSLIAVLT